MTRTRKALLRIGYRYYYQDDTYFKVNLFFRITLVVAIIGQIITLILALNPMTPLPVILLPIPVIVLSLFFLYIAAELREKHLTYARQQYRMLSSDLDIIQIRKSINVVIDLYHIAREWAPVPYSEEYKIAFTYAGISPQEVLNSPMTSWTVEDINVYAALNRETLPC